MRCGWRGFGRSVSKRSKPWTGSDRSDRKLILRAQQRGPRLQEICFGGGKAFERAGGRTEGREKGVAGEKGIEYSGNQSLPSLFVRAFIYLAIGMQNVDLAKMLVHVNAHAVVITGIHIVSRRSVFGLLLLHSRWRSPSRGAFMPTGPSNTCSRFPMIFWAQDDVNAGRQTTSRGSKLF